MKFALGSVALAALVLSVGIAHAQDSATNNRDSQAVPTGDDLSIEQARLADRFEHLEIVLSQLAELSAATDPNRARLLREAVAQSREQDLNVRFESIVKLLEEERLSAASRNQTELRDELDSLLKLLLKADRDKEPESERDRVRKYLKEVGRLIRMQKGVRARTAGGDDFHGLAGDQQRVADDTGKLGGTIQRNERDAKGGDAPPSSGDPLSKPAKDQKSGNSSKPAESSKPGESSPPRTRTSTPCPARRTESARLGRKRVSQRVELGVLPVTTLVTFLAAAVSRT